MKEFIDKTSDKSGTPLNRSNLMAVQGFETVETTFVLDANDRVERIIEENSNGETLTTKFNADGSITEIFSGEKTISKDIEFVGENSLSEEVY